MASTQGQKPQCHHSPPVPAGGTNPDPTNNAFCHTPPLSAAMSVNLFTPHCCRIVAHRDNENNSQSLNDSDIVSDVVPGDIVSSYSFSVSSVKVKLARASKSRRYGRR
jgi:hypothetical protein